MSLLLNTGAMHYRESANDAWKLLVIKSDADLMVLADEYSTSATYQLGEYCRRDGKLYRCITAITTAEAWNSSHWLETTIGAELETLALTPAAAIPITSGSYNLAGLTAEHIVVYWGFSSSAENSPPADITVTTSAGYFTVTVTGTTSESFKPVFTLPTAVVTSAHS